MCGIAGLIGSDLAADAAAEVVDRMCTVIRHRGPDDQGVWVGRGVALGMRRLSIIDLGGGHQPIFNEDRTVLVVFNGEIYNYRELQQELRSRGHVFSTDCDTEVIVHAYEEYGDACVTRLRGMFTFALWDSRRRRLLATRDRFGKKPLNYYWDGRRLIFGSEIKSILETGIDREMNPIALDEYFCYGYVPSPLTLFQHVFKLPPGHRLTYEAGGIQIERYWDLTFEPTCRDDEETVLARTRALLGDAVQVRLMSDVPLGAFLSGGIDSSIVVGLMSRSMSEPVKTFSIGFDDEAGSELPFARRIARHFGTDHHEFVVKPELVSVLPRLVWAYDEPFADSSMVPTYYVSKLAREFVTVALTGDGGDEIFGGYTSYQHELSLERLPAGVRSLGKYAAALMPEGTRGKKGLAALRQDLGERFVAANSIFPLASRASLYSDDLLDSVRGHDPRERAMSLFRQNRHLPAGARMQHVDAHLYLSDDILVKVDKASMLNSLETRTPLLDQHLAEYVSSLPPDVRMGPRTLKRVLKRIAADMLPHEIAHRGKHGFSMPVQRWLASDLADYARDVLLSSRAQQRGLVKPEYVHDLLRTHADSPSTQPSRQVWALLCLELWFQAYMDPGTPAAGTRSYIQAGS